jgi:hypothetical protein
MTARQPRRTRRRTPPAQSLPRPVGGGDLNGASPDSARTARRATGHREHHVTQDYSYIHKDLITVAAVGAIVLAFVVALSFRL